MNKRPGSGAGRSRASMPCDRKGAIPSVAIEIVEGVNRGLLPPSYLKYLSKKQIISAIDQGLLPPSVLNDISLRGLKEEEGQIGQTAGTDYMKETEPIEELEQKNIRSPQSDEVAIALGTEEEFTHLDTSANDQGYLSGQQIAEEVATGRLPPTALRQLSSEDVFKAIERSILHPSALKYVNNDLIKEAVANKRLSTSALKDAEIDPTEILEDITSGKLSEEAFHALTPEQIQNGVKQGKISESRAKRVLKSAYKDAVKDAVVNSRLPPSALRDAHIKPSDIVKDVAEGLLPEYALQALTDNQIKRAVEKGQISPSIAENALREKGTADIQDIQKPIPEDEGSSRVSEWVMVPIPEGVTHSELKNMTPTEVYEAIQEGKLPYKALDEINPDLIKQAVAKGELPPETLLDAGIRKSQIIRDVVAGNMPEIALQALTPEEIQEAVTQQKITPSMAKRAQQYSSIESILSAVAKGELPITALKTQAHLTGSQIAKEVAAGKIPESALKLLSPEELYNAIQEGVLKEDQTQYLKESELKQTTKEEKVPDQLFDEYEKKKKRRTSKTTRRNSICPNRRSTPKRKKNKKITN